MAQFVKLGKRRINLDAVAFTYELEAGGLKVYLIHPDANGDFSHLFLNEQEKAYLLHILDWLDASPVAVSVGGIKSPVTWATEPYDPVAAKKDHPGLIFCSIPGCGRDGDEFINGEWYCRVHKGEVEVRS